MYGHEQMSEKNMKTTIIYAETDRLSRTTEPKKKVNAFQKKTL